MQFQSPEESFSQNANIAIIRRAAVAAATIPSSTIIAWGPYWLASSRATLRNPDSEMPSNMPDSVSSKCGSGLRGILSLPRDVPLMTLTTSRRTISFAGKYSIILSNAHSQSCGGRGVIDLNDGNVHLSCEPGAGKSTFCMNIARTVIESGNSVIWSCMRTPNPDRFSVIFEGVDRSELVNLKMIEFGDCLPVVEEVILDNLKIMGDGDLLVIDDWCEPIGRPKKEVKSSLIRIIEGSNCGVIVSSSAVGNASGSGPKLVARGGELISRNFRTVMLQRHPRRESMRILSEDTGESLLTMGERGLSPV